MKPPDTSAETAQARPPVNIITNAVKFQLGQCVTTPGALALMQEQQINPSSLLLRHIEGDWGDTCADDAALNEQALADGSRLMSVYRLVSPQTLAVTPLNKRSDLPTVWIITEALGDDDKRASTCILLPEDY